MRSTRQIYENKTYEKNKNSDFIKIEFCENTLVNKYVNGTDFGMLQSIDLEFLINNSDELDITVYPLHDFNKEWIDLLNMPIDLITQIQKIKKPQLTEDLLHYVLKPNTPAFELAFFLSLTVDNTAPIIVNRELFDKYLFLLKLKFTDIYIHVRTNKKKLILDYLNFVYLKR